MDIGNRSVLDSHFHIHLVAAGRIRPAGLNIGAGERITTAWGAEMIHDDLTVHVIKFAAHTPK
jgi:hypothetical protein